MAYPELYELYCDKEGGQRNGAKRLRTTTSRNPRTVGGVPTTPDPNTSARVSRYKWEADRDTNWWCIYYFLPMGGHTFAKVYKLSLTHSRASEVTPNTQIRPRKTTNNGWELVDPIVADPVAQDNTKRNNIQMWQRPRFQPTTNQKNPRVRKIFVRDSGAGNGCANFMDAWKNASVLQENPCP